MSFLFEMVNYYNVIYTPEEAYEILLYQASVLSAFVKA